VLSPIAGAGVGRLSALLTGRRCPNGLTAVLAILGVVLFFVLAVSGYLLLTQQRVGIAKGRANGPHRTQPYGAEGAVHLLRKRASNPAPSIDDEF
jgi:hypothetical protein